MGSTPRTDGRGRTDDRSPRRVLERHRATTSCRRGAATCVLMGESRFGSERDGAPWIALAPCPRVLHLMVGSHAGRLFSPPANLHDYAAFARAFAKRYGRGGDFWRERPEVPLVPITSYEIWNEPNAQMFWRHRTMRLSASPISTSPRVARSDRSTLRLGSSPVAWPSRTPGFSRRSTSSSACSVIARNWST